MGSKRDNADWARFERDVQELLNLRSTISSGNQWHDPSDGVSRVDDPYKVMVDCKHTDAKQFTVAHQVLLQMWEKATSLGYRFALPVRFGTAKNRPADWVVITLDDYAELVEAARDRLSSVASENAEPKERPDSDDIFGQQHLQETS